MSVIDIIASMPSVGKEHNVDLSTRQSHKVWGTRGRACKFDRAGVLTTATDRPPFITSRQPAASASEDAEMKMALAEED